MRLRDPRLLAGIVLIIGSTLAGWFIIDRSSGGPAMVAAKTDLAAGAVLNKSNTMVVDGLGAKSDIYLQAADLKGNRPLARPVGKGEVVPKAALTSPDSVKSRPLVVAAGSPLPASVKTGDQIELWEVANSETGQAHEPALMCVASLVAATEEERAFSEGVRLEVRVPNESVSRVLAAQGNGSKIVAVAKHR
ncbi:hypothetical protein [Winkia neuii]|nr:hypothetical protein [Winkia neuii]